MKSSVYVETSVLSFLCADLSPVLKTAVRQQATREWWNRYRGRFDCHVSSEVLFESSQGDPEQAKLRVEKALELQVIGRVVQDLELTNELLHHKIITASAFVDATHLAIAVRNKMDFLLTWNLKHLANPRRLPMVYDYLSRTGRHVPAITTPSDLMESMG